MVKDVLGERDKIIAKINTELADLDAGREKNSIQIEVIRTRLDSIEHALGKIESSQDDILKKIDKSQQDLFRFLSGREVRTSTGSKE